MGIGLVVAVVIAASTGWSPWVQPVWAAARMAPAKTVLMRNICFSSAYIIRPSLHYSSTPLLSNLNLKPNLNRNLVSLF
jgi:hypothetical protein